MTPVIKKESEILPSQSFLYFFISRCLEHIYEMFGMEALHFLLLLLGGVGGSGLFSFYGYFDSVNIFILKNLT